MTAQSETVVESIPAATAARQFTEALMEFVAMMPTLDPFGAGAAARAEFAGLRSRGPTIRDVLGPRLLAAVPLAEPWCSGRSPAALASIALGRNPKERCRALGIPWVARKVPPVAATRDMVSALKLLSPSTFAQCLPKSVAKMPGWANLVARAGRNATWMAHNGEALLGTLLDADLNSLVRFVRDGPPLHRSVSAERIVGDLQVDSARMLAAAHLPKEIGYPWPQRFAADDWEMTVLTSHREVLAEGIAFHNCMRGAAGAASYWYRVVGRENIIASVRHDGLRKALCLLRYDGSVEDLRTIANYCVDKPTERAALLLTQMLQKAIDQFGPPRCHVGPTAPPHVVG